MMMVVGKGEATVAVMSCFSAAVRNAVRYADPITWTGATALAKALGEMTEAIGSTRGSIGVVAVSDDGPAQAIAAVAEASAAGFSSPMRYPAANPGSLAGVACITQDLHGPTMNLTMPVELGIPIGGRLAAAWLERAVSPLVVLLACRRVGDKHQARCLVLGLERPGEKAMGAGDFEWLSMRQNEAL